MDPEPDAPTIDPSDFDAIGVMTEVVVSLRGAAMERQMDIEATVAAPPGRHHLTVFARTGGHVLLGVRFDAVTLSRRNVIDAALTKRGWQLDEDDEGATRRFPPGTDVSDVAFEALAVLTIGGTPATPRRVTATDATGAAVPLSF